jgi:ubiquinone/menaquinone biosynthesis C-methylase UbiE
MEFHNKSVQISQNLKKAYDQQYKAESGNWRQLGAEQKVKNILRIVEGKKYESVLEVGAGDGSILELLNHRSFANEFHGLEISESGVAKIKEKNISRLKSIQLFDGYKLPFESQSIDLIILSHVLEHVEHERILLREIKRVGKAAVIEVPKDYRFNADKKINHFLSYGHINIYTPTSLKFLLLTENFKIVNSFSSLYSKASFFVNSTNIFSKLKSLIIYGFKKILTSTPFEYINNKFVNTVTVLVEPIDKETSIF